MFKAGDVATILATGKTTTIVKTLRAYPIQSTKVKAFPVETADGIFDEVELHQAHPSVLFTTTGQSYPSLLHTDEVEGHTELREARWKFFALPEVQEFREALQDFDLDVRGHLRNGKGFYDFKNWKEGNISNLILAGLSVSIEDVRALNEAIQNKVALDRWVDLGTPEFGLNSFEECPYCDKSNFRFECNGVSLRFDGEECPRPNGYPPNEWELNVPSGKLVVANDLRDWFPNLLGERFDVNNTKGTRATTDAYASVGLSHAFVGNSCPAVFELGEGSFKIASGSYDDDGEHVEPTEGKQVASICTDLWWYSICDSQEFKQRSKQLKLKQKDARVKTINVKPGVYRFRHFDEADRDAPGETIFSVFEWVREVDAVQNLVVKNKQAEPYTANAYVQASVKHYPTLYCPRRPGSTYRDRLSWEELNEEQKTACWRRVADQLFFTIGNGVDWSKNGCPAGTVDPKEDVDPPQFRNQFSWYPFSKEYTALEEHKAEMAPSFVKLAFRILESVISFGMSVADDKDKRYPDQTRERMLSAVKLYRGLAKKHSKLADPEYLAWLKPVGRAEAWVSRFNLGPDMIVRTPKEISDRQNVKDFLEGKEEV